MSVHVSLRGDGAGLKLCQSEDEDLCRKSGAEAHLTSSSDQYSRYKCERSQKNIEALKRRCSALLSSDFPFFSLQMFSAQGASVALCVCYFETLSFGCL